MAMSAAEIESLLNDGLPGARVELEDLMGDGDHYSAHVIYEGFRGLTRIKQHQLVYGALKGKMGGDLHALALKTSLPEGEGI
ncbi:MAG: BolA family transcriptional regulator [Proteobacteria bacterium]|nr:BolA family transcriptional regulator [Pseudomonadota bacterium]